LSVINYRALRYLKVRGERSYMRAKIRDILRTLVLPKAATRKTSSHHSQDIPRSKKLLKTGFFVLTVALAVFSTALALATTYTYDANGRLIVAKNDLGQVAQYNYDNVGNLLSIDRLTQSDLTIFGFSPGRGAIGSVVKIQGNGFSSTASQNIVRFNGSPASVTSATSAELITTVPVGATSGTITVTVGVTTVASSQSFVVDSNAKAPQITSVTPTIVQQGETIAVTGQYLEPQDGDSEVLLDTLVMTDANVTETTASFSAPNRLIAGKVAVSTIYGTAYSTEDVLVLPEGSLASDISQVRRLVADAPAESMATTDAGKKVAMLFDATAGSMLTLQFSSIVMNSSSGLRVDLYRPDGVRIETDSIYSQDPTYHLPMLNYTGTYIAFVYHADSAASWQVVLEKDKQLVSDLDTLQVSTTQTWQSKRIVFQAQDLSPFNIRLTDTNSSSSISASLSRFQGASGSNEDFSYTSCSNGQICELRGAANRGGTYQLVLRPDYGDAFSVNAQLLIDMKANMQADVTFPLALSPVGRKGRISFFAEAGNIYSISLQNQHTTPTGQTVYYSVYSPSGAFVASLSVVADSGIINLPPLASSGTYTLLVDPPIDATLAVDIKLTSGVVTTVAVDGASVGVATSQGQRARVNFSISATSNLGIGVHSLLTPGSINYARAEILRADGTAEIQTTSCNASDDGCDFDLGGLPAGDYALVLTPPPDGNGSLSFDVTATNDMVVALTRDTTTPLAVNRRGQNIRVVFDAVQGEWLAVSFMGQLTNPTGQIVEYAPTAADGSIGNRTRSLEPYAFLTFNDIAQTQQATAFIGTEHGATFSVSAKVLLNNPYTITVDEGSRRFTNVAPGVPTYLRYSAAQGANLGLGFTQITAQVSHPAYAPRITVREPTYGGMLVSQECSLTVSGCEYDLANSTAGIHNIEITPPYSGDGNISFDIAVSTDVVASLQPTVPTALSLPIRGHNARLSFAGISGKQYFLDIKNASTIPSSRQIYYSFYKPDGSFFTSFNRAGNSSVALPALPTTGTYKVFVDPTEGASYSATLTLAEPITGTLVVDGATQTFNSTIQNAPVNLTFVASAGANLGLGITGLVTPGSTNNISASVYNPTGSFVTSITCLASAPGCELDLPNATSGTYRIELIPPFDGDQTLGFSAVISTDVTGTLVRNQQNAIAISKRGQNGRFAFTGTASEVLSINVSGQSTTPSVQAATYSVLKPDGTTLKSADIVASGAMSLGALPTAGTYTLLVDPASGASLSSTVGFTVSTPLTVGGTVSNFSSTTVGASALFSFTATAGQNIGLGVSDLITTGSTNAATVTLSRPDGSTLSTQNCLASNNGCDLDLPALPAGLYSIAITPPAGASMSFGILLSADTTAALALDVPLSATVSRRGQNIRATFAGTSGQTRFIYVSAQTTTPTSRTVNYTVYRPNGVVLSTGATATSTTLSLGSLPTTGTYTVLMDPADGETFNAKVTLESAPSALAIDGSSVAKSTTVADQIVQFSFTATAGQNLGLGLSALTTTGSTSPITVQIYRPDGSLLGTTNCLVANGGCQINLPGLTAGAHRIRLSPPTTGNRTMSLTATLSADATGTLNLNTVTSINVNRRGKNARYTFSGTAAQNFKLVIASQTTSPSGKKVFYTVLNPNGTVLGTIGSTTATLTYNVPTLPTTGTYTVLVDPEFGETATMTINRQTR
jgi:trimeric autotransporter adhesin